MLSLIAESDSEWRTHNSRDDESHNYEQPEFGVLFLQAVLSPEELRRGGHTVTATCAHLLGTIGKSIGLVYTMNLGVVLPAPEDSPVLTDRSPIPEPCFRSIHFQL